LIAFQPKIHTLLQNHDFPRYIDIRPYFEWCLKSYLPLAWTTLLCWGQDIDCQKEHHLHLKELDLLRFALLDLYSYIFLADRQVDYFFIHKGLIGPEH
tara:strand:+ start:134 stop:427 length:294 start_codon:yes stop_codon:yes gene_type:complete